MASRCTGIAIHGSRNGSPRLNPVPGILIRCAPACTGYGSTATHSLIADRILARRAAALGHDRIDGRDAQKQKEKPQTSK